jgi:NADP-dependent 3-hydroxy acid dehydrogenase YdfG
MTQHIAIVGAGPGVGMGVARTFGTRGFRVSLLARNTDSLASYVKDLAAVGVEAAPFRADVLEPDQLVGALRAAREEHGPVDVLLYSPVGNQAGSPSDGQRAPRLPRHLTVEKVSFKVDQGLLGAVLAVGEVLPGMLERRAGSILFTSAPSAKHQMLHSADFGVAQAALRQYSLLLHEDVAPDSVFVGFLMIAGVVRRDPSDPVPEYSPGFLMPAVDADRIGEKLWGMSRDRDVPEDYVGDMDTIQKFIDLTNAGPRDGSWAH